MVLQIRWWACSPEGSLALTPTSSVFLQSVTLLTLADSRSSRLLSWTFEFPSTQVRFKGPPCRQVSRPVFVPSSGFGYPHDGLLPSNPSEPYLMPTASMGFYPSELRLPARYYDVPTAVRPHAVSLTSDASARGPCTATQAAASGFLPSQEMPASRRPAPVGFSFLGFSRSLNLIFPSEDLLSCAWLERLLTQHSCSHYRVSIDQRLATAFARRNGRIPATTLLRFEHAPAPQH